jgi:DUF1009 family protein
MTIRTEFGQSDIGRAQPACVGILAGGGPLPGRVADAAVRAGHQVFVVAFQDYADPLVVERFPHAWARPAAAGRILSLMRDHGCRDIVLIGPVKRPGLRDLRPDAEGARLLARIGRAFFAGDDGLLAAIVQVLGEEGFTVRGAHEFLAAETGRLGTLGRHAPDEAARADIARGWAVLEALGRADVGQACVVQGGAVLAVEAIEGTDRMVRRAGELALPGPGGVLVKRCKPGQDRRADMPALGPETVVAAAASGLRGVAFEAGGTLLIDESETIARADAAGLFLLGFDPEATRE